MKHTVMQQTKSMIAATRNHVVMLYLMRIDDASKQVSVFPRLRVIQH